MKPMLMGAETEYAVAGRTSSGPVAPETLYALLSEAVRQERLWMADIYGSRGAYLENGSRFYLDSGGHPEYATPECSTPAEVACHDKAGERLLAAARARVVQQHPDLKLTILKNNLEPVVPDAVTWGCHEAYTCWVPLDWAAPQLLPHLATRVFYAGSGCLSAHPEGMGFELSQRARHLVTAVGRETTSGRALFCTRTRKEHDRGEAGWVRAHLIAKDAQRSLFGIYLTFATTGLLFLTMTRRQVGRGLALAEPLQALRAISRDPWLRVRVPLADGRHLTALEIQEAYLAECAEEVHKGGLPEWAGEALRHWQETLALAQEPARLAGRLDAYTKLLIYENTLAQAGYSWGELREALGLLTAARAHYPEPVLRAVLAEDSKKTPAALAGHCQTARALLGTEKPGRLERLRLVVRLQALDLSYHELGGLYDQLGSAGHLPERVVTEADVERATREPPGGRAAARSAVIRAERERDWLCGWQLLYQPSTGRFVDLRDPFAAQATITSVAELPEEAWPRLMLLELLARRRGR
jgi:hypothetical protein